MKLRAVCCATGLVFLVVMGLNAHAAESKAKSKKADAKAARKTAKKAAPNPAFAEVKDDPALPRVLIIGDSISIGYTQVGTGDSPNIAFERADKAVYWAKSHGRDQVCSHATLVAEGHLAHESKVGDVELF